MSNFKFYMNNDLSTFFNEFAEIHKIKFMAMNEGENEFTVPMVIDEDVFLERKSERDPFRGVDGLYYSKKVVHVRLEDIREKPAVNEQVKLDDELYVILECSEAFGVVSMTLGVYGS